MAYRAEIEIGVKGAKQLDEFKSKLERLGRLVENTNKTEIFGTKQVTSLNEYNAALGKAVDTLNNARLQLDNAGNATKTYKRAIEDYVTALGAANERQAIQNRLIEEEISLRTEAARAARLQAAGLKDVQDAYSFPIGPGPASSTALSSPLPPRSRFFGGTQYSGPIGPGPASSILGGQSSPIDVGRLVAAKKEQLEYERALFNLAKKTAEPLNLQLQLQEGLVEGAQEALNLAQRARGLNQFPGGVPIPGGLKSEQVIASAAAKRTETLAVEQKIQRTSASTVTQYNLQLSVLQRLAAIGKQINESTEKELVNQRRINRLVRVRRGREAQRRRKDALGSGIIGAAFPLLFGQGVGASVGGGLGGAAGGFAGGQLGFGLSLVGTALGSAFDNLVSKSQELGQALNPLTADLDAVIKAAGLAGTEGERLIKTVERLAGAEKAQQVAAEQLAVLVGKDGVEALQDLGEASTKLSNELAKAFTALQAAIAPLLANILGFVANRIETTRLVNKAVSSNGTQYQVRPEFAQNQAITGAISQFKDKKIDEFQLQKQIAEEVKKQEISEQNKAEAQIQQIAGSRAELEQAQLINTILKGNSDLTDKAVQQAEEKLILSKMEAKETEIFRRWQKQEITNAQFQLELQTLSLETDNERLKLKERIANATKRAADEAERERKERERAQEEQERALKIQRDGINKALSSAASIRVKDLELETARAQLEKTSIEAAEVELKQNKAIHEVNKLILGDKYAQNLEDAKTNAEKTILMGNYAAEISLLEDIYKLKQDTIKATIDQTKLEKELQQLRGTQETGDLRLGLSQELEGLKLPTGDFLGDERENLKIKQQQRYAKTIGDVNKQLDIQQKIIGDTRASKDAQDAAAREQKLLLAKKAAYQEMLPQIFAAEQQQLAYNQALSLVEGPVSSLMSGLRDVVAGTKSVEEAFADFLQSLADTLLQYATQMIATYIALGVARAFGLGAAASSTPIPGSMPQMTEGAVQTTTGFEGMYAGMAANGGQVDKGETYIVGERGPEVFTATSNGSIIPGNVFAATRAAISNGTSSTNEAFAENSDAINTTNMITKERMLERERLAAMKNNPIDIRYESSVINSVEYVTAEQHRQGLAQAAERGRALTLQSLRNSPKTRKKVGV